MPSKTTSPFLISLREGLRGESPRRKYLVGVSGGRDSMALLHGLLECGFRRLVVCHMDHRLRGGVAAADAIFVVREARRLGLRFIRGEADVALQAKTGQLSIETAARLSRHQFFANCARLEKCSRVFLGHHMEDQVETILHHFFRGSGRRGLAGMQPQTTLKVARKTLVLLRPLLDTSRADINSWVESRQISWREDASNCSPHHSRNRLRNELIPALEKIVGRNFRTPVLRASKVLRAEDDWLDAQISSLPWKINTPSLPAEPLRALHLALQRRAVLHWLRANSVSEAGFREVESVLSLIRPDNAAPPRINLPGNLQARRRSGKIFLCPAQTDSAK